MYKKINASSIRIVNDDFMIRKLKEADYLEFMEYVGMDSNDDVHKAFRDAVDFDDTLAMFVDGKMAAAFLLYDERIEKLEEAQEEGLSVGFTGKQEFFESGQLIKGYGALVDFLLEHEVDYVSGKCKKDNMAVFKVLAKNRFVIFDEDKVNYYLVKIA